jgi:hypothetical protein
MKNKTQKRITTKRDVIRRCLETNFKRTPINKKKQQQLKNKNSTIYFLDRKARKLMILHNDHLYHDMMIPLYSSHPTKNMCRCSTCKVFIKRTETRRYTDRFSPRNVIYGKEYSKWFLNHYNVFYCKNC